MTTATITRHRPTLVRPRTHTAIGPYAPVPYCDEHNRYLKGCPKCRRWNTWHSRAYRRRVENGERTTVPIAEVRDHIAKLTAAGLKNKSIYTAAGLTRGSFDAVIYKPERQWVTAKVAQKILAVPVPNLPAAEPPRYHYVDPVGSMRRIRALHRIGWTLRHIAAAGQLSCRVENIGSQQWVTTDTAAGVKRAYDRLSMTPGPSARTAARAAREGWASPLAWDENTIDDPAAQPNLGDTEDGQDGYDPITVGLAVDGRLTYEQLNVRRPDLIEAVRRLAQRLTDIEIAHHLRWPGADKGPDGKSRGQEAVCKLRLRNGIPGPEKFEAVYAYGPRSRARTAKAA